MLKSELQIVAFLSDLALILVDKVTKKSKCMQTIYPQLLLMTKGVVQRLCKGKQNSPYTIGISKTDIYNLHIIIKNT